jgi:hypothetical protein
LCPVCRTEYFSLFVIRNILQLRHHYEMRLPTGAGVAQSLYCLTTDWTIGVRSPAEAKDFSCSLRGPPCLLSNGYRGPFPGGKARPARDADHSPSFSAEVKNE